MKKKAALLPVILLLILTVPAVSAWASDGGGWNRRIASPSYGFNIGLFTLTYGEPAQEKTFIMPGIDLRHFNGINVTRSGGFYYGYEYGVNINLSLGGSGTYSNGTDDYTVESILAGTIVLMAKHGYRKPIGDPQKGLGLGFELGLGAAAGVGTATFKDADGGSYDAGEQVTSPVFEASGEVALRAGENHRLTGRLGVMLGVPLMAFSSVEGIGGTMKGVMVPPRLTLRFGFVRDH